MTTPILMPSPRQKFTDSSGKPLANGMLFTYAAGTSTPQAAFQDAAGTVAHPNPIRLDARGEVTVYFIGNYKIDLKTAVGNQVAGYPVDNFKTPVDLTVDSATASIKGNWFNGVVATIADLAGNLGAGLIGFLQSGAGGVLRSIQDKLREKGVSVKDFGAKGDGVTDDTASIQAAFNAAMRVYFPATSSYYKITKTITYKAEHTVSSDGPTLARIVMTDDAEWAFACDPVLPTSAVSHTYEIQGGGFFGLDIRAKYGIRLGTPNFASSPNYDYASFADFIAASQQVQNFEVHDCVFMPRDDYSAGYAYIAASPGWNTSAPPSISDLYARGVGVLLCNAYRASVKGNTMKFSGMAVWLYGSDFATVERNRIANCLRWVNVQGIYTGGYQCKIKHNDFLSSYRWGGLYTRWVNHTLIEDNYFENSGADTNSTINWYIVDTGVCTNFISNRFDDYGSTKTTGPLVVFNGPGGAICTHNRVADNRPGGAGTLAALVADPSNWSPAATGLSCGWGSVQMGTNDPSWPRVRHPIVQYDLDGDPLKWAPLAAKRDTAFRDYSGGGVMNSFKFEKDAAGLWFLNPGPFQNGIYMKPAQTQLTKGLDYVVTVRSRCVLPVAPFTVTWTISWVTGAGVKTDLFAAAKTYTTNTAIEELTQAVSIPAASEGSFVINVDEVGADLYSIAIAEA